MEPDQLDRALAKIENLRSLGTPSQQNLHALISDLADSLRQTHLEYPNWIASRLGDRLWFIDLPSVTHFFAEDKLTYAQADGKTYCVDYTVAELEKKLNPKKFIRIHRSTLLNVDWIKEITSLPWRRTQCPTERRQRYRPDRCPRSRSRVQSAVGMLSTSCKLKARLQRILDYCSSPTSIL